MRKLTNILLIALLLVSASAAAIADPVGTSIDPTYLGVGARPLGMGKAYVAVAEDADSIFINPAGLGRFHSMKLTSMYSNLMGDAGYTVLAGAMPLDRGSIGLGFIQSRVDGIWVLDSNATATTHYPVPTDYGSLSNSVLFLSYGCPLDTLTGGWGENVYVGANVKYFDQSASGTTDAEGGNGKGIDLDLGLLYVPSSWLTIGVTQQNLLPSSMGGSLAFRSGIEESVPSLTKVGARVNLMGKKERAIFESPVKVNLAADGDFFVENPARPSAMHLGAEIWPVSMLALRVGYDQDPVPSTVDPEMGKNLTYGVGLRFKGIAFDYAYHPYSSIQENATHFFSISYVGEEDDDIKDYIAMLKPRDKLITKREYVRFSGIVVPKVDRVEINGVPVGLENVRGQKSFKMKVDLDRAGKNLVIVEAFDSNGKLLETKRRRILKLKTFADVPDDYWAEEPILLSATAGMVDGYPDRTFQPDRVPSRAESTTLMVRAKGDDIVRTIETRIFPDLPKTYWASRYIAEAKDLGLVIGYPDKKFHPEKRVNRAEGVSVSSRFDGEDVNEEGFKPAERPYDDISTKHWAATPIDFAKEKGLLNYLQTDRFEPKKGLTRAELVEILARTDYGKEKIDYLLDWNKGYGMSTLANVKESGDRSSSGNPSGY